MFCILLGKGLGESVFEAGRVLLWRWLSSKQGTSNLVKCHDYMR